VRNRVSHPHKATGKIIVLYILIFRALNIKEDEWAGHVARMGDMRNAHKILVGKHERERSIGKPWRIWKDNIKMDLREMVGNMWTGCIWLGIGINGDDLRTR
jgi:hypothetical protein